MMRNTSPPSPRQQWGILLLFLGMLWGVELLNLLLFRGALVGYGIQPRHWNGLRGILVAPLLHAGFSHLATNSLPLLILGWLTMLRQLREFFQVTLIAWLSSGLGVWLFASPGSIHVGISGVIFGYLGFLIARGWFERSRRAIALSLLVIFLYGGLIWGVLPAGSGISWQGHLFGFLSGVVAGRWFAESPVDPGPLN